jgi:oligopeptide transport system substrate-binding protein
MKLGATVAPRARKAAQRFVWLCAAGLALATAAGCWRKEPHPRAEDAKPRILRVSQRNEPATLDTHLATLPDEFFILRAITEGLVTPNPDGGAPVPGVAERWEASEDGLTWTFHLRANAKWSNGDAVTAHDFVAAMRRALTPGVGAPKARLFYALRNAQRYHRGEVGSFSEVGVSAADDRTLVLQLEAPTPHLLALAASGPWLPLHRASLEKHGAATSRAGGWTRPGEFVGNGPFALVEWRPDQHILVSRNTHYWQPSRVKLDGIRFQIYDSGDTEERAFRAGQVDVTMAVPFAKLGSYGPDQQRKQDLFETRYLALNTRRAPLDNPQLRRALALSIDRRSIVENVTKGGQRPALGFIPPGLGGYRPGRLLSAGAENREPAPDVPVRPLEFSAWGVSPAALEAIQQMWRRALGITVNIVQREGRVHLAALGSGDFDIAFTPAIPDFDDPLALLGELTTGAPGNYPQWSNARFDALVAEAARTSDNERRLQLYQQAEAILLAELPVVPLYFNTQNYLVAPHVRGWRQDALWNRYYLDVSIE